MTSEIPVASILLRSVFGIVFLYLGTIDQLIELPVFLECVFETLTIFALVVFRWTMPDAKRTFRVPYVLLVLKLLILGYIFYATLTSTKNMLQYAVLASLVLAGLLVYFTLIKLKCPVPYKESIALTLQKLLLTVPCDNSIMEDLTNRGSSLRL